ncbi:Cytochrome c oxidase subunit 6A1, mitochondrial [Heterocephalus glaber]|uniref:Cytochrome c oxidase subunit 6A1, mitochondrial n=1 Tax=Heterocephalus glaber TaxID=10181 RepID=G5APW1_HETGA|nr:Cytochrome c oxidase subunit 6A1, mitochondrial [Heterocephalus glaber]
MSSGAHGQKGSAGMWKALTYFVALPRVGESMLNVFLKLHHRKEERHEFIAYPISVSGPSPFHGEMLPVLNLGISSLDFIGTKRKLPVWSNTLTSQMGILRA